MDNNETFSHTNGSNASLNGIGELQFSPMLAPNVVFAITFGAMLLVQVVISCSFWRYYGNAIGMVSGLLLELLGSVAKVQLAHDRHNKHGYIMYIICLTLGPTFLSSALYLSIGALMRQYPTIRLGRLGPAGFSALFILGDFVCLCFIGVGGSLAAIFAWSPVGVDLMIAGLGTQILFTAIFCALLAVLFRKMRDIDMAAMRYGLLLEAASLCLFVRSCWRAAELSGGFNGRLASKEGVFIALESVPMVAMSALLIFSHPGFLFKTPP